MLEHKEQKLQKYKDMVEEMKYDVINIEDSNVRNYLVVMLRKYGDAV